MAGPPNLFSPQTLTKFSCPVVGVKSMCVQLGAEPGVHPQLYRFATLISLELSSSQVPPFLVHWLEIQSFHLPVLSYSSCDCLCYQFYGTWNSVIFPPNLLAIILLFRVLQELLNAFSPGIFLNCNQWETWRWCVLNPSLQEPGTH